MHKSEFVGLVNSILPNLLTNVFLVGILKFFQGPHCQPKKSWEVGSLIVVYPNIGRIASAGAKEAFNSTKF